LTPKEMAGYGGLEYLSEMIDLCLFIDGWLHNLHASTKGVKN